VTKQSLVLELLHQDGGASLVAIVAATGWLPHTARAALTGLRKQGHTIARDKVAGETRYAIGPVACA
jgi:DNA-binding IclR family transcriptional regulator